VPTAREVVSRVADPPVRLLEPRIVEASLKVTAPVGEVGPGEDTVAVRATLWPAVEGLTEDVRVVVVG